METLSALFSSRKFLVGTMTVAAIAAAAYLVATGKLMKDELIPTITAITAVGMTVIGSVAAEDVTRMRNGGVPAKPTIHPPPPAPKDDTPKT